LENLGNVLIRSDLNVPVNNGVVLDNFRIVQALTSLKKIRGISKNIVYSSHLGRPKGIEPKYSLKPIKNEMESLLQEEIIFIEDCLSKNIKNLLNTNKNKIFLLENLRFHDGEMKNDNFFAKKLVEPFDSYILDAFGASHRAHASIVGISNHIKCYQGELMQKEIYELNTLISNPTPPYSVILGGAKISDKLSLVKNLLPKVDNLLLGGGMCFTFLKAKGLNIGKSIFEENFIKVAEELMNSEYGKKIILPDDIGVTDSIESMKRINKSINDFDEDDIGVDIGPKTIKKFYKVLTNSKTIFWNGPMGIFEIKNYSIGTQEVTDMIANSGAYTIVGGGDSVNAINTFSNLNSYNHVSTGGGASIELLEGKKLPGVNIYESFII